MTSTAAVAPEPDTGPSDAAYQDAILPSVSRTFALTIPELPAALRGAVTNAYLLCRIADTVEDEPTLDADAALELLERFVAVVHGREDAEAWARDVGPRLSPATPPGELDLIRHTARVIRVTRALPPPERAALERCVAEMCLGMHHFQRTASVAGLARVSDLNDYCYFVAGIVGRMLTDLFCSYSPAIAARAEALHARALSFGQGLQMTNILKDVWEDRARGACWLPREVFANHGVDLAALTPATADAGFAAAMRELIGMAATHLRAALDYTLLIPADEAGIRRFCLRALGLAVLTLRKIERTPGFTRGAEVKITRSTVAWTVQATNLAARHDGVLRFLYARAASALPEAAPLAPWRPPRLRARENAPPVALETTQRRASST